VTDKNKSSKVERQKIQVADKKASKGIKKKSIFQTKSSLRIGLN
jgi:hypothetical protein